MPATRTIPSTAQKRRALDPYRDVQVRDDPRGPLKHTLNQVPHRVIDAELFGAPYKKYYSHLELPEYSQPVPKNLAPDNPRPPPLNLCDFEAITTLGAGVSGSVVYAKTGRNAHPLDRPGSVFAIKIVEKRFLREFDPLSKIVPESKQIERSILTQLPWNPFVCGCIGTFTDALNVYYAFEFCPQNSLRDVLNERLEPRVAQFYFCGIVAGLAFLHSHDIVHRDMKPENVFIGPSGYPVIGDFGTARRLQDDFVQIRERRISSPVAYFDWDEVGTFAYNAPEIFTAKKTEPQYVGPSIDWWAAGIILYEMLTRKFPFYSKNEEILKEMVTSGRYRWPEDVRAGQTAKGLVAALLTLDPLQRLGTYGVQEVMDYPWFKNVDWAKIHSRQYLSPVHRNVYPEPGERWHQLPLPKQQNVPGLRVVEPPIELRNDKRHKEKVL